MGGSQRGQMGRLQVCGRYLMHYNQRGGFSLAGEAKRAGRAGERAERVRRERERESESAVCVSVCVSVCV